MIDRIDITLQNKVHSYSWRADPYLITCMRDRRNGKGGTIYVIVRDDSPRLGFTCRLDLVAICTSKTAVTRWLRDEGDFDA